MDHIFDQLDQLRRGARNVHPRQQVYETLNTTYSARDQYEQPYNADPGHYDDEQYGDENVDPQMSMSQSSPSFETHKQADLWKDPRYSRIPEHSQHRYNVSGRARASVLETDLRPRQPLMQTHGPPMSRSFDLSQYAHTPAQRGGASSSSPANHPAPSSPAFSASQRRPAVRMFEDEERSLVHRPAPLATRQPEVDHMQGVEHCDPWEQENAIPPSRVAAPKPTNGARSTQGPPIVQGIALVSTRELPDRFRSIFPFPLFNAIQSKSFQTIYKTNDNFVLSSPTGSGKTAILELAICRMMNGFASGSYKIVYQAPTKSLCSERQRDWQAKFGPFDLQVAELTGDTDATQLRNVQHASIIVTTPEKWDSMTRKWKDHQRLMQMVKLFLIDEVHILKEDRGATLEAIVSRMKSVGSDMRFVALSATVPNSQDIATWLGKDLMTPHVPAPRERFGEEFRPVKLSKNVCGYNASGNDFAFQSTLNSKLPDVVAKWSQRKPIMVFCFTRNACVQVAKLLANWWSTKGPRDRFWEAPRKRLVVENKELKETITSGVSFHHAGLSASDRGVVEKGYLDGDINVICCTSTLAVGVNLPCHMVIIMGTVTYAGSSVKEYSDLEIMQMLGRAGRPQFDDSAVAVIMTRLHRVQHYDKMVTGQEVLESCLHRNLIDHLNAEICLGTITSLATARKWLSGTFLYVRLKDKPEHYKIDGNATGRNLDERLDDICSKALTLLYTHDLAQLTPSLRCTEFGDAMSRYYIQFETMKVLLALPPKAKTSEILSAIAQAGEFKEMRFKAGEKTTYKELNKSSSIKFPIPVNLDAPSQKVSLVIQSVLGAVDLPTEDSTQRLDYTTAKSIIFQNAHRLVRCVIDCQLYLEDSVTARNALALSRSLGAQVWDDSPLHMKQLEGIGMVYVRKLVAAGVQTIDTIETTEQHRLEHILSRNPPFGMQLQDKARAFPKLRVGLTLVGEPMIKKGEHVAIKIRAELGFINEKPPETFQRKPVYVCLLVELSDGHLVHFARISGKKLNKGQEVLFGANLTKPNQLVHAYLMCDSLAGTLRLATLKLEISASSFPPPKTAQDMNKQRNLIEHMPNTAKRRAEALPQRQVPDDREEFDDAGIDDNDLVLAESGGFANIDDFENDTVSTTTKGKPKAKARKPSNNAATAQDWEPRQLDNGKWECNHACKDKTSCKHLCCREGLDKKPKPPKPKESKKVEHAGSDPKQTQLSMPTKKSSESSVKAVSKQAQKPSRESTEKTARGPESQRLNRLHESVKSNTRTVPLLSTNTARTPYAAGKASVVPSLSFTQGARRAELDADTSDYGGIDELPSPKAFVPTLPKTTGSPSLPQHDIFDEEDDEMLDDFFDDTAAPEQVAIPHDTRADGHVDLSSYTQNELFDDDWAAGAFDGGTMDAPTDLCAPNATPSGKQPFLEESSDSAAIDLGLQPQYRGKRAMAAEDDQDSSSKKAKLGLSTSTATDVQEPAFADAALPPMFPIDDLGAVPLDDLPALKQLNDQPSSSDDPFDWFEATFGAEGFNYVGRAG